MTNSEQDVQRLFRAEAGQTAGLDSRTGLPRILLVDDEPAILSGLSRTLRSHFSVTVAEGGGAGIEAIDAAAEPFAVIITDMRMPVVDGVGLLKHARAYQPDTVRILLTGYADLDSAIAAVNEGNVFRFLTKPADSNLLRHVINDGVEFYRLIRAEKELLEGTLRGAVGALIETLSLANPAAFSRAIRIRGVTSDLLDVLDADNRWEIEVAAMLSQVGVVTLTPDVLNKLHRGVRLTESEQEMVDKLPEVGASLLKGIPRLDGVRDLISGLRTWQKLDTSLGTRLIRLATDIEDHESRGMAIDATFSVLKPQANLYGEDVMEAFRSLCSEVTSGGSSLTEVSLAELTEGMTLGADIYTSEGALLVGRGQTVNESLLRRLHNFAESGVLPNKDFLITGNS